MGLLRKTRDTRVVYEKGGARFPPAPRERGAVYIELFLELYTLYTLYILYTLTYCTQHIIEACLNR